MAVLHQEFGPAQERQRFSFESRLEMLPGIYNVAKGDLGFFEMLGDV